jgi:hypothetical protein
LEEMDLPDHNPAPHFEQKAEPSTFVAPQLGHITPGLWEPREGGGPGEARGTLAAAPNWSLIVMRYAVIAASMRKGRKKSNAPAIVSMRYTSAPRA